MQLNNLTTAIPGLQFHCNTRKAVLVCAREYIAQLQTREKRLRAQLMAHHLRERALVAALLKRGATPQQIADENMLATPSELERVSTAVESMIAESPSGVPGAPSDFQGPQIAQLPQQAPVGKSRPRDRAAPYPVTSTSARRTLF